MTEESEVEHNGIFDRLKDLNRKPVSSHVQDALKRDKLNRVFARRTGTKYVLDVEYDPEVRINMVNYRMVGYVQTPRLLVAYCWSTQRNEAGYFLGWRQVKYKSGKIVRDQFVARKTKRRLKELQTRRHETLKKSLR